MLEVVYDGVSECVAVGFPLFVGWGPFVAARLRLSRAFPAPPPPSLVSLLWPIRIWAKLYYVSVLT